MGFSVYWSTDFSHHDTYSASLSNSSDWGAAPQARASSDKLPESFASCSCALVVEPCKDCRRFRWLPAALAVSISPTPRRVEGSKDLDSKRHRHGRRDASSRKILLSIHQYPLLAKLPSLAQQHRLRPPAYLYSMCHSLPNDAYVLSPPDH